MTDEPTFAIVTSAPNDRPAYRRDLLNCLCHPNGVPVRFTYRRKWIDQELLKKPPRPNALAIVVLADIPSDPTKGYKFLPVRLARIQALEPEELVQAKEDDVYLALRFSLERLVRINPSDVDGSRRAWQEWVESYSSHPRPRGHPYSNSTHFVFPAAPFFDGPEMSEETAWRLMGEEVASAKSLQDCNIFRVAGFCSSSASRCQSVPLKRFSGGTGLELRGARSYKLCLEFVLDPAKASRPPQDLSPSTSISSVRMSQPLIETIGFNTKATILVTCARTYEEEVGTLVIENPKDVTAKFPRAEFAVRVRPQRGLLTLIVIILFLGALATGVSAETIRELAPDKSWFDKHAAGLEDSSKLMGGALLALAGYLGFRKLPGS